MGYKVSGRLHVIKDTRQVTERFRVREFVVETDDNPRYPQFVQFQLSGDRCEQIDGLQVGDQVRLEFSLRGREWTSPSGDVKYFNSLDVWTLEQDGGGVPAFDDGAPLGEQPPMAEEDIPF